jgi:hypothetical protein
MRVPISDAEKSAASAAERILHNHLLLEELARIPAGAAGRVIGEDSFDTCGQRMVEQDARVARQYGTRSQKRKLTGGNRGALC